MELISAEEYLAHAGRLGIGTDPRYRHSEHLVYFADSGSWRFWSVPVEAAECVYFVEALLRVMEPWESIDVSVAGRWSSPMGEHGGAEQRQWNAMLRLLGVPQSFGGALRFRADERDPLALLLLEECAFGLRLLCDLSLIPDHGRQYFFFEHHQVVWGHCRTEPEIEQLVEKLVAAGYPLPEELPDETFKPVSWIAEH